MSYIIIGFRKGGIFAVVLQETFSDRRIANSRVYALRKLGLYPFVYKWEVFAAQHNSMEAV